MDLSGFLTELRLTGKILAFILSNEETNKYPAAQESGGGCSLSLLNRAFSGETLSFDRHNLSCPGAARGMGFSDDMPQIKGGIGNFLSNGAGAGFPPGERIKNTPETGEQLMALQPLDVLDGYRTIIVKPYEKSDNAALVTFLVTPDQLSALIHLFTYRTGEYDRVIAPMSSGCAAIFRIALGERKRAHPRAVIGNIDIYTRPYFAADTFFFTIPHESFRNMLSDADTCFFRSHIWKGVQKRIYGKSTPENTFEHPEKLNRTLAEIAKSSALYSGDLKHVADMITQKGCLVLATSRLEVWRKVTDKGSMKNISTFETSRNGYVEDRPDFEMPDFEEYETMLKTERLFTTNDAKMYEIFLSTRDDVSSKSIASIEAPIWIEGELAGVICFEQESCEAYPHRREWSLEEHHFTASLADFMTIVIVNAERRRLEIAEQEARAEKERISAELSVATQIQASMLPCIFPAFPDRDEFDIYGYMLPAKEVGGDFYDFFLIGEHQLAVVIADVSGKGVPAALFMVIAKTLIKNNAQNAAQGGMNKSPKEVFETVNEILCENNEAQMFVTAFMGIWDMRSGIFTYVNAGHNPPLIKRSGGEYEWLSVKPGFVLAGMEGMVYRQNEITLHEGDMLCLYTDGVTEAVNPRKELFTELRLLKIANLHKDVGLNEFINRLKAEIDIFADGAEQADDITLLILKIMGGCAHERIMD